MMQSTTEQAAVDISSFLSIFFSHFPSFSSRALHLAGESYGGRYIPVFAAQVYDDNRKLIENGLTPLNLSSVVIGNGISDHWEAVNAFYDVQCTGVNEEIGALLDIS
jgi:carboxypeptidase C (cathepsin A)